MGHSIWILEYGYVDRFPASNLFAAQPNEGHRRMPYCFGLVRSQDRYLLVDTGFADPAVYARLTAKYGETRWASPADVLRRVGVAPERIDAIALTHSHIDHAGCLDLFPNAHVYIQRREVEWQLAERKRPRRFEFLTRFCQPDLPELLAAREDRVTYADGPLQIWPGVELRPAFDTHTTGSQLVVVDDHWVFAGDTVYTYENLDGLHGDGVLAPIGTSNGSAAVWLDFADDLLTFVGGNSRRVLPFHEQRVWETFPSREYGDGLHVAEITLGDGGPGGITAAS